MGLFQRAFQKGFIKDDAREKKKSEADGRQADVFVRGMAIGNGHQW